MIKYRIANVTEQLDSLSLSLHTHTHTHKIVYLLEEKQVVDSRSDDFIIDFNGDTKIRRNIIYFTGFFHVKKKSELRYIGVDKSVAIQVDCR